MGTPQNKHGKKNKKSMPWIILMLVMLILMVMCVVYIANYYRSRNESERQYEKLKNQVTSEAFTEGETHPAAESGYSKPSETAEPTEPLAENPIDFKELKSVNDEVYAWISIPGTNVDYPIAQSASDNSYYLHHTIEGNYLFEGTIYSENYNSTDFEDPNTVLYGHTMRKNDAMFTSLHNYTDKDFFDSNRTVYIYMPGQVLEYKIFAAYAYDDRHLMLSFDFEDKTVFKNYLDSIFAVRDMTANIDKTVEITENDRIITLSTCIDGQDTKRFLVQAVLVQSTPSAR